MLKFWMNFETIVKISKSENDAFERANSWWTVRIIKKLIHLECFLGDVLISIDPNVNSVCERNDDNGTVRYHRLAG